MAKRSKKMEVVQTPGPDCGDLLAGISDLLDQVRRMTARAANSIITPTYWEVGRRIVEYEQGGKARAEHGEEVLASLAIDLTAKRGRGFSKSNLALMRSFYLGWEIFQTPSGKLEARANLPPMIGEAGTFSRHRRENWIASWCHITPDVPRRAWRRLAGTGREEMVV